MFYCPEGMLINTQENDDIFKTEESISAAIKNNRIAEGVAVRCDELHNLIVSLPHGRSGIIPREEGAIGIKEGLARDIAMISRVSKPVCFVITKILDDKTLLLSRCNAQEICKTNFINKISVGDIIPAIVTHFESYGCFVDIGCGTASLIPIDSISISRISHPRDRFVNGQHIFAVVKNISEDGKICLSHKELLGTWAENSENFRSGETVCGIVRSITNYGVFVELTPNLAGLAELKEDVAPGDNVSVFIKSLIPEKMKVKLAIVDAFPSDCKPAAPHYFIKSGKLEYWRYSPEYCDKIIESDFLNL